MKLRDSIYVLLACASLWGLSSCAETDYANPDSDRVAVTFAPEIEGSATRMEPGSGTLPQTRAVDQTWSENDKIGIAMVAAGDATTGTSTYNQYVVSGGGTSVGLLPVSVDQTLFYPTNGSDVNFVAFSPFATVAGNTVEYTAFADQATQAKMEAVDFLYHKGTTAYNKTSGEAALAFGHKLSKIIIRVATTSDANAVTLSSLEMQITGTPGSVIADLADGTITAGDSDATVVPYHTSPDTDTRVATAILVPHTGKSGRTITFAAQEGNFTYTFPNDHAFEGGKEYTLEFSVTHQGVTLTGSTIENWDNGSVDWEHGYALELVETSQSFEPFEETESSFSFKSNHSGTLRVVLSTDPDNPAAGEPDWVTDGTLAPDVEDNYTAYTYSFTVAANETIVNRTAYGHVVDGEGASLAVVTLFQNGKNIMGLSNSYLLVPDGSTIYIPVSRANSYNATAIGETDIFAAEFLWADAPGLLSELKTIGTGSNGFIKVAGNSLAKQGNVHIAVKVKGSIKWSWHIWVTDYMPKTSENGGWMDRNLGATSAAKSADMAERVKTFGLLYQWGRKDPFPGSAGDETAAGAEPTVYSSLSDFAGYTYAIDTIKVMRDISWTVVNPTTFVAFSGSWMLGSTVADINWKNMDGSKTIYDPCPSGYRVPVSGSWGADASAWSSFTWNATYKGRDTSSTYGGWYAAAGRRPGTAGALSSVGALGFSWAATPYSATDGYFLHFNNSSVTPTHNSNRANGHSIRCCQE